MLQNTTSPHVRPRTPAARLRDLGDGANPAPAEDAIRQEACSSQPMTLRIQAMRGRCIGASSARALGSCHIGGRQCQTFWLGIDMIIDPAANVLPQVRTGGIRGYAVTAGKHPEAAPEIPTVDEAGVPGLHVSNWTGLFAPKGTSNAVIAKLNAALTASPVGPCVQQTLETLAALHKAQIKKWWPIIKAAGMRIE
jgi:Tripartite tricarboxylate transporter family receptor